MLSLYNSARRCAQCGDTVDARFLDEESLCDSCAADLRAELAEERRAWLETLPARRSETLSTPEA